MTQDKTPISRKGQKNRWRTHLVILFLVIISSLSGCTPKPTQNEFRHNQTASLDSWLEYEVLPYLTKELGEHPRFKNQPFLLVAMDRENVSSHINGMALQLRERIIDALLTRPGVALVWRPAIKPYEHHTSFAEVTCRPAQAARYYVGIDTGISDIDGRVYVKIRALDIKEQTWVNGLSISWTGDATQAQKKALKKLQPDEYLLGLRPLPFNNHQADLLASYISHNLSCMFTSWDLEDLTVHVRAENPSGAVYFNNTFTLVKNYLAKFREVQVTDDPAAANVQVTVKHFAVHDTLYQVWATAKYKKGEVYLPGAETEAYVSLSASDLNSTPAPDINPQINPQPPEPREPDRESDSFAICFYNSPRSLETDIYPLLVNGPNIHDARKDFGQCSNGSACFCYQLSCDSNHAGSAMYTMMAYLKTKLSFSGTVSHRMTPVSPSLLQVWFDRGFD